MDKKTIMEMNKKWKDFRLQEYKIFQPGFQHGFDLSDFKISPLFVVFATVKFSIEHPVLNSPNLVGTSSASEVDTLPIEA